MKFKQIAVAAALAAMAATPALAAIANPNDGNGELVLVVLDRTDNTSYLLDLGLSLDAGIPGASAFDGNGSYSYTLSGGNWNSFLGAAAATSNDLEFAVFGADVTGTGVGDRRLFSTVSQAITPLGNGLITNSGNNITGFLGYQLTDVPTQTHSTVANGDSWASAPSNAFFLTQAMDSFNGVTASQGWVNTNPLGTNAIFRNFTTSTTSNGPQSVKTDFAGVWTLTSSYVLTYAPTAAIPEAEGVLLLLAGLGALAFVGRRREEV